MKIVILDRKSVGEDLDLSEFEALGELVIYDYSAPEEIPERVKDADVIILNKMPINEKTVGTAERLKLVCVTATGTNNLDKAFLESRGIEWRNVAGYSTEAVAQHTFALLFYLLEHLSYYDEYVKSEKYVNDTMFTHFDMHFHELSGKKWGIIGLGAIGRRTAEIASCFGCQVSYYSTSGKNHSTDYREVSFDELLRESDIISVHAPLNERTEHLINADALAKMKKTAILINVGRGPIIAEEDLAAALENGTVAAAGLDVIDAEPMREDNPLKRIKDSTKLLITPHIAWAATEARERLMKIIAGQIREYKEQNNM